ncbi:hypothetical protein DF182_27320 [Chitinophaga flava]|uniref:Uncharacterized protein n=1 Tax=Chitinophaga flava TaxID=2259036 RepID=A0A365XVZ5_9BACT|nr:hypothetical protein DF182_27320 [Chitinophaga flava]
MFFFGEERDNFQYQQGFQQRWMLQDGRIKIDVMIVLSDRYPENREESGIIFLKQRILMERVSSPVAGLSMVS